MSVAGGLHLAFERIREVRGTALQIFTKNQLQWNAGPIDPTSVEKFRQSWEEAGWIPVAAHDSYLINLAAVDASVAERSVKAFAEEINRCEALGIRYLVAHPGSHRGDGIERGLDRFTANLDRSLQMAKANTVNVLIEITAGQGSSLGSSFEEIAHILAFSQHRGILGVCFDTSHAFAAGYDLRNAQTYRDTFAQFDRIIGIGRIKFFHLNDSKGECGSRIDRHEHIGKGKIGLEGFRLLLNDPRFRNHPMVLETPKGKDLKNDRKNLRTLRSLMAVQ